MNQATELIGQQMASSANVKKVWGTIIFNVKDLIYAGGAVGDGIKDDTSAVQAAINDAVSKNATLVFFPPGTYKVTSLTNTSTINFVGDNAVFSGYVKTILEFGVSNISNKNVATIIYNIVGYGAKGDGTTNDTAAIKAAIAAAKAAGGGIVYIPQGKYLFNSTLTIDASISLQGAGSDTTNMDTTAPLTNSVSALVWGGGASVAINVTGVVGGVDWRDFVLDGATVATIGINIDQLRNSTWNNVKVIRCATIGVKMVPIDLGVGNSNAMFNSFINVAILRCPTSLHLNGTGISNCCHNSFVNLQVDFSGGDGIYMGDTDNNSFFQTYCYKRSGVGYGVRFNFLSRSNYFWHFQGDMKCESGSRNIAFGYDRENGQPRPIVDAGATLQWTENGNNGYGWHMAAGIEGLVSLISGDNTLAVNATPDTTLWKIFRGDTSQQISIDLLNSGRKARHWYYDGAAAAAIEYMEVGILGIDFYYMGGKKVTSGTAMPTTGTWNQGDYVRNNAPTVLGAAASKYVVKGWTRITTGSANVLNTDWVEDRALTGT